MLCKYMVFIVVHALCVISVQCINIRNIIERKRSELDPEIFLNSTELLHKYYYSTESHVVNTEDGYVLNVFRISRNGPPILLVHGIGDSSDSWVVLGPKRSLAFLLADAGYDVWLFNCRGNKYSRKHSKKIPLKDYWDFSYEEIGTRDLPATVDYILSQTYSSKITYLGFSQGSTSFLVFCSLRPEYNSKIDHAILLAPVAWLANIKHPLVSILSHNLNELTTFFNNQKIYEFANASELSILYHATVCNVSSPISALCALETYSLFGLNNLTDLVPKRLPIITTHTSAAFSIKTLLHYLQLVNSKRFCRFDHGRSVNKQKYSSSIPPDYDVSMISVPMTMFVSETDWYSSPEDVKILTNHLKNKVKFITIKKALKFSHLEFVYGSRVNSIINVPILKILKSLHNKY